MASSSAFDETLEGLPVRVVDVYGAWSSLFIGSTIPLGRLEWIWNARGASVRESSLSAKAVFETSSTPALPKLATKQRAEEWYRKPYFHVFVIPIAELETTKETSGWPVVRQFVDFCRERSDEYIVAVVASEFVARQQRKLLERVRAEVNVSIRGRERVVTVPAATVTEDQKPITHLYNSPSHQDLLIKLRECSRSGVEARVQAYENELARLLAKRASRSFSFCTFFSAKEAMGFVFCQLGRRDIALKLLDELYASMLEIDGSNGAREFCKETPCAAASNVTNVNGKAYKSLFTDETITEIEMRTYLFARQTEIMLPDRKFADIAERGLKLITAISRRCIEEYASDKSPNAACFRDAWVFTAARALASTLAPAIPSSPPNANFLTPQLSTPKERHTARLIAGFHVHALKAFLGLAKMILPDVMAPKKDSDVSFDEKAKKKLLGTFSKELRTALGTPNNAEILFSEIANAAASLYEMGGRSRGAAALDGDAGVIRLRNGSLSEAEKLLNAQCSRFNDDYSWDDLHLRKRKELARAEKELDKVQEYLVSCLTMLFMTREVRKINGHSTKSQWCVDEEQEHAAMWAKEAYETAGRLPRVMKYDAEKLVAVSVRPNKANWCEGDSGEATVVIESDIPADVKLDYVFIELRGAVGGEKKGVSALRGDKSETPSSSRSAALVLKSKGDAVIVKPGSNDVKVYCSQVMGSGRYSVSLVGLFLGKLKLVKLAPKIETSPTVLMKASSTQKESIHKTASQTPPTDMGKAAVRFPCFFSKPRAVPVSLFIRQEAPFYLTPGPQQIVEIDVTSDAHGIAEGSSFSVHLRSEDAKEDEGIISLVDILSINEVKHGTEDNDDSPQPIYFKANAQDGRNISVTLEDEIPAKTSIVVRVSMRVPEGCTNPSDVEQAADANRILSAEFAGKELSNDSKRLFSCTAEHCISVLIPVSLSSRSDLHTRKSEVSHVSADSVVPAGTLVCTLQSKVVGSRSITLESASLDLPEWLQVSDGETAPYADLLPCTINHGGRFVFAFDVDVCSSKASPGMHQDSLSNVSESLSAMRHARISKGTVEESGQKSSVQPSPSMELEPIGDGDIGSDELPETSSAQSANIDSGTAPAATNAVAPANAVVDLSGGIGAHAGKAPNTDEAVLEEGSFATLRVHFTIEGIDGRTLVQQKISMHAFRPQPRMYRVERHCTEHVSAGEPVELTFCISVAASPLLPEQADTEILQYEINADPHHWIVAGRKRGRMRISREISDVGRATLLPLVTGRILVPDIRLYNEAGGKEGCVETFNECMQVIVLPCANVTAVCARRKSNKMDGVLVGGNVYGPSTGRLKAHMPAVVTFDSFFEP